MFLSTALPYNRSALHTPAVVSYPDVRVEQPHPTTALTRTGGGVRLFYPYVWVRDQPAGDFTDR